MPGAAVEDYDGKNVTGSVEVKVGPITVTYKGTAVFEEQDESAHRMVLIAGGRETRGQGAPHGPRDGHADGAGRWHGRVGGHRSDGDRAARTVRARSDGGGR